MLPLRADVESGAGAGAAEAGKEEGELERSGPPEGEGGVGSESGRGVAGTEGTRSGSVDIPSGPTTATACGRSSPSRRISAPTLRTLVPVSVSVSEFRRERGSGLIISAGVDMPLVGPHPRKASARANLENTAGSGEYIVEAVVTEGEGRWRGAEVCEG